MFRNILVPLDRSALSEQALGTAEAIAQASRGAINLVIAHEMAPYNGSLVGAWSDARDPEEVSYLRRVVEDIARGVGLEVDAAVATGTPVHAICQRAREIDADLIVMTSHGRTGVRRALMGSVADGVIRTASVPVLMLRAANDSADSRREQSAPLFRRILVPVDGSVTSSAILQAAAAMAQCNDATVILLRVVASVPIYVMDPQVPAYPTRITDPDATRQAADAALEEVDALAASIEHEYSIKLETVVQVSDSTANTILDVATSAGADLIAMTTHGRGASRLIVGSVTDKVLRGSYLPMLLLYPGARARVANPAGFAASGAIRQMAGLADDAPTP